MGGALIKVGEQLSKESDPEQQSFLSAAFVRLSQEASSRKNYQAVNQVCAAMETVAKHRPVMASELRPRVGIENRCQNLLKKRCETIACHRICSRCCAGHAALL